MNIPFDPSLSNIDRTTGTLMWIGRRDVAEFQDAYRFCESVASQMAYREDVDQAIGRPAGMVGSVIIARDHGPAITAEQFARLQHSAGQAKWLELMGRLCQAAPTQSQSLPDVARCRWHRWNQVLPKWLSGQGETTMNADSGTKTSVAIIAASFAAADPLMDLAVSQGATAVWCRQPDPFRVRGVDVVWWDDSVARHSTTSLWQQRIADCGTTSAGCRHVWLANAQRVECHRQASQGGVDLVLSKPFDVGRLIDTVAGSVDRRDVPAMVSTSKAA